MARIRTLIDREFLATLPRRQVVNGMGEILKMALVKDATLFGLLESDGAELVCTAVSPARRHHERGREGRLPPTTLQSADWQNSRVCAQDPEVEVARLKALDGPPLGASGGATFAQYLSSHDLVDEYRLTVHPVFLGAGKPIFAGRTPLEPVASADYPNGVVVRTFRPRRG